MKKWLFLSVCFIFSIGISAQEFKFEKETINYGKVALGSNGKKIFSFTNIGTEPIIIDKIISSCGCTVPKKPDQPIMPGEKGTIEVIYDTKRPGGFSKAITIFSNAKSKRKVIKIKGFIAREILPTKEKSMLSNDS